ncbi:MAG: hypothetical protein QOF30_396 [Acidimicrobiaceae bacterium]|nr:hypothetical protein [Acidimicrobiaceae bacterium]
MTPGTRWACAVLVAGAVFLLGASRASRASAAPSALVVPVRPVPTAAPADLGRLPCLPALGCDPLGGLGQEAAKTMARAIFGTFGNFVADGVRTVLDQISVAISKTTQVTLDQQWFQEHLDVMRSLAVLILLPLMLVGLISAVIHRDAGQLLRAGGVYVPVAIIGAAVSVVLTERALEVTDWATAFVTGDLNGSANRALGALGEAVATVSSAGAAGVGTFLTIIVLLLLMAGALLIWIELLLRTGAIYVVVLFLPIAMSGLVWKGTVNWTRRMIEVLVALLLSKFVIVVVIDLAAGMITAGDGIGTIMQGATLLLLAACAPFALLRMVPMVEAGVIGHLERMERRPIAVGTRAAAGVARQVVGGFEGAVASQMMAGNGSEPASAAGGNREEGGQLNAIRLPDNWSASSGSAGSSSAGGSSGSAGAVDVLPVGSASRGASNGSSPPMTAPPQPGPEAAGDN